MCERQDEQTKAIAMLSTNVVSHNDPAGRLSCKRPDVTSETCTISVVIAWVNPLELLLPCLESLERQTGRRADEVIVVTRWDESEQHRLLCSYPAIDVLSASANTPITSLRSIGIKRASGDVIAVTEDHCVPCGDWISTIELQMKRGCAVVGGPVENAS